MTKITQNCATNSVLMLEKSYLHQNGVELNFLFIGLASRPAISLRINPRIHEDSKGMLMLTIITINTKSPPTLNVNLKLEQKQ